MNKNISNGTENNKNAIVKYKILRLIGYLPFVGVLFFTHYFTKGMKTNYGFNDFVGSLIFCLLLLSPFCIAGTVLIIKSSSKIKILKNSN